MSEASRPFDGLGPEVVLTAIECFGARSDGHQFALNSFENRVYQVGVEDGPPLIIKFYRPNRWSDEAILEEHGFAQELVAHEIPVVAPLADAEERTLFVHSGFRYAVYPRRGGRWPDLEWPAERRQMGRFLGRMHALGAARPFVHRPGIDVQAYAVDSHRFLLDSEFLPPGLDATYRDVSEELITRLRVQFDTHGAQANIRLHGDCHRGNILWSERGPAVVDLDDCRTGPAVQDLWMLLAGSLDARHGQLADLVSGYGTFHLFDPRELALVEALRALRLMHYAAWLARRWDDPAFPRAFPWFNTPAYWEGHIQDLREQLALLDQPPLELI